MAGEIEEYEGWVYSGSVECASFFLLLVVILVPGPVATLDLGISEWLGPLDPSIFGNPEFLSSEILGLDDISALKHRISSTNSHGVMVLGITI